MKRMICLCLLSAIIFASARAENCTTDSAATLKQSTNPYRFRPVQLIAPGVLIGAGLLGLGSDWVKFRNTETRDELQEHRHPKVTVDDFSQFAPLASTFTLKACGVKSMHGYADMALLAGTSYVLVAASVYGLKSLTRVERPDGSTLNSFPSGHTATAFAGAELLRREYWRASPWIGVGGYVVAAATGFLRMYNNRHWLTDVVAGAGLGILCTEAAYWLYPLMSRLLPDHKHRSAIVVPTADARHLGFSASLTF